MVVLAVIGIIYGALVAMVQPDVKKLVAYSSVSHLGFVMLGIWGGTVQSVQGALMVMISHGFSTGALFLLIGMLYERRHTRLIDDYGGIARVVPVFSLVLTVVALSSIGLPGLNGFVGEFLVLLGSFERVPVGHRHRDHRRHLRRGLPALGAAADDLQPARQAGERAPHRPDAAGARRACCRCSSASSGSGSIRRRCSGAWSRRRSGTSSSRQPAGPGHRARLGATVEVRP